MESQMFGVHLIKTVSGLADGTREWRNCFLATARGLGFETSVLETCVLVLRGPQQRYHGIIGVAVNDITVESRNWSPNTGLLVLRRRVVAGLDESCLNDVGDVLAVEG